MSFVLRSLLIFATITCCVHQIAEGQVVRRALSHIFCHKCRKYECGCAQPVTVAAPPAVCATPAPVCPVPPPTQEVGGPVAQSCTKTCTTVHPVVETRYRQENYMTSRTECRTAFRQEAYCETVPQTCIENVTRDEGCYKLVWVPKPVTRQVAKTFYTQQTKYRAVPYQYTVQVPEMKCRVVPEQRVHYVQKTQTFVEPMKPVCAVPPPITAPTCAVPTCATPGAYPTPLTSHVPDAAQAAYHPAPGVTPTAHSVTPWTPVTQRTAAGQPDVQGANYMQVTNHVPATPTPAPGAPTAAAVWQSRQ